MDSCDVLIVGGGPAGSACAWKLRQAGLDVLLLDKARFPRDKVCAGWITPAVVKELALDIDEYSSAQICQPILGFRTGKLGARMVETRYHRPVSFGIRRCEFDSYLLRRCGARVIEETPLLDLRRSSSRWIANGHIQASLVVGAGGHFCPVARLLGAKPSDEPAVVAQEAEFQMTAEHVAQCAVRPEIPELYFCPDMRGYGWCLLKQNYLNIGFGRIERDHFAQRSAQFVDYLQETRRIPAGLPIRMKGHAYMLYHACRRKRIDDGVILIGDAAGLAYSCSGEGIRPAIESGLLAADVVLKAKGDFRRECLEEYLRFLDARCSDVQSRWAALASRWLPERAARFLAGRLLATRLLTRHILLERWFLHADLPALYSARPAAAAKLALVS